MTTTSTSPTASDPRRWKALAVLGADPVHAGPRHHRRERRAAAHPARSAFLARRPGLGRRRLRADGRRAPAARRPPGRHASAAGACSSRRGRVRGRLRHLRRGGRSRGCSWRRRFIQGARRGAGRAGRRSGLIALLFPDPRGADQGARHLGRDRRARRDVRHRHLRRARPIWPRGGGSSSSTFRSPLLALLARAAAGVREPDGPRARQRARRAGAITGDRRPDRRRRRPARRRRATPWGSGTVLLPLLGGVGAARRRWSCIEARSRRPLIPLRSSRNRTRVVTNVVDAVLLVGVLQLLLPADVVRAAGAALLAAQGRPLLPAVRLSIGAGIGHRHGADAAHRREAAARRSASSAGAVGLLLTSQLHVGHSYASGVLPGMVVLGLFFGLGVPADRNAALHEVTGQDSSLASGVQGAMQQSAARSGWPAW